MSESNVALDLLLKQVKEVLDSQREMRELRHADRKVLLENFEFSKQISLRLIEIERRLAELHSDAMTITKMEVLGSYTHLQTMIEQRLDTVEETLHRVADSVGASNSPTMG